MGLWRALLKHYKTIQRKTHNIDFPVAVIASNIRSALEIDYVFSMCPLVRGYVVVVFYNCWQAFLNIFVQTLNTATLRQLTGGKTLNVMVKNTYLQPNTYTSFWNARILCQYTLILPKHCKYASESNNSTKTQALVFFQQGHLVNHTIPTQ